MKILALLVVMVAAAFAEDAPRQLNPNNPSDAVQIIDMLTKQMTLTREHAQALTVSIQTLDTLVKQHLEKAKEAAKTVKPEAVKP